MGVMGVIGALDRPTHYNLATAVPATFAFTGNLSVLLGKSLVAIPDQNRRAGPRDRRWAAVTRYPDQRRRREHHRRVTPSTTDCGWCSGSSWRSLNFILGRHQLVAVAAVRRRAHPRSLC